MSYVGDYIFKLIKVIKLRFTAPARNFTLLAKKILETSLTNAIGRTTVLAIHDLMRLGQLG